jgi:hypothetical protein
MLVGGSRSARAKRTSANARCCGGVVGMRDRQVRACRRAARRLDHVHPVQPELPALDIDVWRRIRQDRAQLAEFPFQRLAADAQASQVAFVLGDLFLQFVQLGRGGPRFVAEHGPQAHALALQHLQACLEQGPLLLEDIAPLLVQRDARQSVQPELVDQAAHDIGAQLGIGAAAHAHLVVGKTDGHLQHVAAQHLALQRRAENALFAHRHAEHGPGLGRIGVMVEEGAQVGRTRQRLRDVVWCGEERMDVRVGCPRRGARLARGRHLVHDRAHIADRGGDRRFEPGLVMAHQPQLRVQPEQAVFDLAREPLVLPGLERLTAQQPGKDAHARTLLSPPAPSPARGFFGCARTGPAPATAGCAGFPRSHRQT